MKVVVISDTHIPERAEQLPTSFLEKAKDADLILHAGDLADISVLSELKKISKVVAVWGNMDSPEVKKTLKEKEIIKIEDISIGLMHGRGHPNYLIKFLTEQFRSDAVDIIIFGHSHKPMNKEIDDILFFNPGSLTDDFFSDYASFGVIEIKTGKYKAKIEKL
ncbi:MAG: YfcE family phosphodiesterase [Candidatus Omnitrophica bacterium]|nr:YfcE family phosphodiesterase [Candidatus Omnitrophota bacterium]